MMHRKSVFQAQGRLSVEKSENFSRSPRALSAILETRIESLNETGADISDLKIKLASYRSYLISAQDKKEDADSVYADKNATRENLMEANNYLLQSISDINKANKLLRDIFEELKTDENQRINETYAGNSPKTKLNKTKNVNNTK